VKRKDGVSSPFVVAETQLQANWKRKKILAAGITEMKAVWIEVKATFGEQQSETDSAARL
jgi:hypothetical protein